MFEEGFTLVLLCLSAFAAGVVNSIAGGGTLLTFPALLWALRGLPSPDVLANATSTVALVPGSIAGAWGFRRELAGTSTWLRLLVWPSLLGGTLGSLLLIWLPGKVFVLIIPWLLLIASLLFLLQPMLTKRFGIGTEVHGMPGPGVCAAVIVFQFLVAIYGGYFGAGIGILMLSSLALMGLGDIHRMNAVKTFLAAIINGISVLIFVASGKVVWQYAAIMAVAAILGGYTGASVGRRLPRPLVRWFVIVVGLVVAAYYFVKQAVAS